MPPLRRAEIQANREALLDLAEALGSGRPLGVEGLAMASLLISDAPRSLACTVREALAALERGQLTASIAER